jgi:hypothetical protein
VSEIYTHRIEIYTDSLLIAGSYDLAIYRRVSDAMNGEQRRFLPLRDATLAPLLRAQQVQRVPHLLIDRSEVLLVATVEEAARPPNYPREEQIRGVEPVAAMFFTTAFVVRATFYKRPDLSLPDALERVTDDFLPLKHVQIYPLVGGFPPLGRDFAALARSRIVALYPLAELEPPELGMHPAEAGPPVEEHENEEAGTEAT